ncbi:XRE family transcriptional regulator [Pseudothauera rhizosphaerae]|nr:LexA family transcriptional regulator [Pseudothauera rhizosphaerae]
MNDIEAGEHPVEDGFIDRLRLLADRVGSANGLAKSAGISQSGLQRYLAGGQPTRKVLIALARAARVDLLWLITGQGEPEQDDALNAAVPSSIRSLTRLPLYKEQPAERSYAGDLTVKPESVAGLGFCRFWLSKHGMEASDLAGLYMSGNSMEPTLANGDTVLVNIRQRDTIDGGIYALRGDDRTFIKRVQNEPGGYLRLISDNPTFKSIEIRRADVDVIGRVVWRGSLF